MTEVLEPAHQDVEGQVGEGVAEVGGVVGSDATHVEGHLGVGLEGYDGLPGGVVETDGHDRRR